MDVLYDIFIGIVSSVLYFVLGIAAHKVYLKIQEHRKSAILETFDKRSKLAIRLSIRQGPLPTSTPRTSIAEVTSLLELLPIFKQLGIRTEIATDSADSIMKHYQNILTIGGPAANDVTALLTQKYSTIWPIKLVDNATGYEVGTKKYAPVYSEDGTTLISDYALIGMFHEKSADKNAKTCMMVMGCRGYGTQGCVASIQSKELISLYKKSRCPKSFVAIIKVNIDKENFHTHVAEFFPLLIERSS